MTDLVVYVTLAILVLLYSLPPISMIGVALKGDTETPSNNDLFSKKVVWDSFRKVLEGWLALTTVNSMKIGLVVVLSYVILARLTGYSLSRFRGRLFKLYGSGIMVFQMLPVMLMLIPLFLIYRDLHLIDTHLSLISSYTCLNLSFSILLIRGSFGTAPYELGESAYMDGGSKSDMLVHIVTPISLPGVATAETFAFLNVWNEHTFVNTFMENSELMTLAAGLQDHLPQNSNSQGQIMAASTIGIVPLILFPLFAQKYLIQGMTAGAVKG